MNSTAQKTNWNFTLTDIVAAGQTVRKSFYGSLLTHLYGAIDQAYDLTEDIRNNCDACMTQDERDQFGVFLTQLGEMSSWLGERRP